VSLASIGSLNFHQMASHDNVYFTGYPP